MEYSVKIFYRYAYDSEVYNSYNINNDNNNIKTKRNNASLLCQY